MNPQISPDEQEQILQTIEMFEVITQSSPSDCQSLEILKDAYRKIGRIDDAAAVSRRLADTYVATGQLSSAMLEYESLLQQQPDNAELHAVVDELQSKMQTTTRIDPALDGIDLDIAGGMLMATAATHAGTTRTQGIALPDNDGNEGLARFLIQHRLAPEDLVHSALERVQRINKSLGGQALAASLLDEVTKSENANLENILCGILDRTKYAYVPLEYYDVDRQVVKMIPETLTLGRLIVPFDLVSRTVMIAMANPFDTLGKEAVQQLLDYNIQWHLAAPDAIAKTLIDAYRLNDRD
jgi:hypothetical protein